MSSKLVSWTVEDSLPYPDPDPKDKCVFYCDRWEASTDTNFSIDKIRNKEFGFKTRDSFFRPKVEFLPGDPEIGLPALQSPTIEIFHKKEEPDVYLRFQTEKADDRFDWGELKTLHFEVSFKSKDIFHGESGKIEGVWQVVKGFAIPIEKREKLRDCSSQETGFNFLKALFHIDEMKNYMIVYKNPHNLNYFRLELPIRVSVTVSKDASNLPDDPRHRIWNTNPMNFMKKILSEGLHSNFNIQVGKMTFPCHKSILAGQSEVFAAMLDSKMSEASSNQLEIRDMSEAGVGALLKYLYYKGVDDPVSSSGIAFELLKAANKYQIKDLELESRNILFSMDAEKFDAKTAFEYFEFCGMVEGFKDGQGKAARVFKENRRKYSETGEFVAVLRDAKPEIVAKLFEVAMV